MQLEISMRVKSQICSHANATVRLAITPSIDMKYLFNNGFYILKGEVDSGFWGLTYELSNCRFKSKEQIKKIALDGRDITFNELNELCYYIAQNEYSFFRRFFRINVKDILKTSLRKGKTNFTYSQIINIFNLKETYLNRPFCALSHNRWIYSCAIGFALGKKVFCFPWLINNEIKSQVYRFSLLSDVAQKYDLIFLLPTENIDVFSDLETDSDKFIYLSIDNILNFD